MPDYFEALREQDLDEMIEEENVFTQDFNIQNLTDENFKQAKVCAYAKTRILGKKAPKRHQVVSGEPYYQIYKDFDSWLQFNAQISHEERMIKLLLCLPLVPPKYHGDVKLVGHRFKRMDQ